MKNIKSFDEFIENLKTDTELQEKIKLNPVEALKEISITEPAYTNDKLIYRIVVLGFISVLLFGVIYFIYQYQLSLKSRTAYAYKVLESINAITTDNPLNNTKLMNLKDAIGNGTSLNGTTPDGIIAVFTAIIGVLAGLFAPSPLTKNERR